MVTGLPSVALAAFVASTTSMYAFSSADLPISVSQGDYVNLKLIFLNFATNPEETCLGGRIYIE